MTKTMELPRTKPQGFHQNFNEEVDVALALHEGDDLACCEGVDQAGID